jgi:two-component system phosphate regulon response regulator PhoB
MARILLVNDEPDLMDVCKMALEIAGHTVVTLIDASEALELAIRFQPELIGLDWVMPEMSGEDVLLQLRATPETRSIPVLVISALEGLEPEARRLGAVGFLPKPFRAEELNRAVNNVLRANAPALQLG